MIHIVSSREDGEWRALLPEDADVYLDPGYAAAAALEDASWLIAAEADGARVCLPIVQRALPAWLDMDGWNDAESPYGYPGVVAEGNAAGWPTCWQEIIDALAERRVISVFVRLSPLVPCKAANPYLLPWTQPTVWIPLQDGMEEAFAGSACRTHRSQLSRARALGFVSEIVEAPQQGELEAFRLLYEETMARVGAQEWYRFPAAYYARLAAALGPRLSLIRSRGPDGSTQVEALFMRGPRWGHYHLSARRAEAHNVAGHVVFHAAAEWGAAYGLAGIHLGGGATPRADDSLLVYKSRIGRRRAAFQCAGVPVHKEHFEGLVARWKRSAHREPARFQAYREQPAIMAPQS
jgi:hypothetical protein